MADWLTGRPHSQLADTCVGVRSSPPRLADEDGKEELNLTHVSASLAAGLILPPPCAPSTHPPPCQTPPAPSPKQPKTNATTCATAQHTHFLHDGLDVLVRLSSATRHHGRTFWGGEGKERGGRRAYKPDRQTGSNSTAQCEASVQPQGCAGWPTAGVQHTMQQRAVSNPSPPHTQQATHCGVLPPPPPHTHYTPLLSPSPTSTTSHTHRGVLPPPLR